VLNTLKDRADWKLAVVAALAVGAVVVWIAQFSLFFHYSASPSSVADPSVGRTYVLNNHGSLRYVTLAEYRLIWALFYSALCFSGGAMILKVRWGVRMGPFDGMPGNVRSQVMSGPTVDYDKVRATYEAEDTKPGDGA
jgi:hypothetical protein